MRDKEATHYIFVASIRLRNGRRIFASQYGLKAFRIKVRRDKPQQLELF